MGEYLSTPNKEKISEEAENGKVCYQELLIIIKQFRYGTSGMQGWRRSMEDSHIVSLDVGEGVAVFGVFDGHGGQYFRKLKDIFRE